MMATTCAGFISWEVLHFALPQCRDYDVDSSTLWASYARIISVKLLRLSVDSAVNQSLSTISLTLGRTGWYVNTERSMAVC